MKKTALYHYIGLILTLFLLVGCNSTIKIRKNLKHSELHYHLSKNHEIVFKTQTLSAWGKMLAKRDSIGCPPPPPPPNLKVDNLTAFVQGLKMLSANTELIIQPGKNTAIVLLVKNKTTNKIVFTQNYIQNTDKSYIPTSKNDSKYQMSPFDYIKDPSLKNEAAFSKEVFGKCLILTIKI